MGIAHLYCNLLSMVNYNQLNYFTKNIITLNIVLNLLFTIEDDSEILIISFIKFMMLFE